LIPWIEAARSAVVDLVLLLSIYHLHVHYVSGADSNYDDEEDDNDK